MTSLFVVGCRVTIPMGQCPFRVVVGTSRAPDMCIHPSLAEPRTVHIDLANEVYPSWCPLAGRVTKIVGPGQHTDPIKSSNARVREIILVCAATVGIDMETFMAKDNGREETFARQFAMWAVRRIEGLSYPRIGRVFRRDHTTVITSCAKIERALVQGETAIVAHVRALDHAFHFLTSDDAATGTDKEPS